MGADHKDFGPTCRDQSDFRRNCSPTRCTCRQRAREARIDLMTEKVGYGSPPVATRFKPGKTGNPRGRPRGTVNLATALAKVYTDTLTVREGDKKRRLPRLEALARKQ